MIMMLIVTERTPMPGAFQTTLCVLPNPIFTTTLEVSHSAQKDNHWQATELTYFQVAKTGEQ